MTKAQDIIKLRERKDWSQQRLADHLGVDQGTVSKWENDKGVPSGPARKLLEQFMADERSQ